MCASAVVMLDIPCSEVVWRVLVTHSIHQFPLHFLSRASSCAITFQLDWTTNERRKFLAKLQKQLRLFIKSQHITNFDYFLQGHIKEMMCWQRSQSRELMHGIMESVDLIMVNYKIIRKANHYVLRGQNSTYKMADVVSNSKQVTRLTVDVL